MSAAQSSGQSPDVPGGALPRVDRRVLVANQRGLHARASAKFVTLASTQPCAVAVSKDGHSVVGTSIMGLMMLGAAKGDHIVISAEGPDAQDVVDRLAALVENRFGED